MINSSFHLQQRFVPKQETRKKYVIPMTRRNRPKFSTISKPLNGQTQDGFRNAIYRSRVNVFVTSRTMEVSTLNTLHHCLSVYKMCIRFPSLEINRNLLNLNKIE